LPSPGEYDIESGVTTFPPRGAEPEGWCISVIADLDMPHNHYSHDPEYTVLEVYGVPLSQRIRERLEECGFVRFDKTSSGFIARKDER
jgi:hypothetical protein